MIALAKLSAGQHGVRLVDVPVPVPVVGEALIDVVAAGIGGTDARIIADQDPSRPSVVLGQEVTGVVSAVGSPADEPWVGVRVAVEPVFGSCGVCWACRYGRVELCLGAERMGSIHDGGFARHVVVPVPNLRRVPARAGEFGAALMGPLAAVVHALAGPAGVVPGDRVLVVGPGTTGFLAAQVARAAGGTITVAGMDVDVLRLETFADLGFETTTLRAEPNAFDLVVECSGDARGAEAALEATRPGGRYVAAGVFGQAVTVPLDLVLRKEMTMTSGVASTRESWDRAARLVESGAVDLEAGISEVIALEYWSDALSAMDDGVGMKILLDPRIAVS